MSARKRLGVSGLVDSQEDMSRLYAEIAPKLTTYLVGSGSTYATACDIVQETFLRVWKRRDDLLDDREQVYGFIFTIARNYRKDLLRKARREVLQAEISDEDGGVTEERPAETADENAAIRRRLNAALAHLPPLLREAFTLFQLGELSVREIARQTNTTEGNVKVRIYRAKEKLREELEVRDEG